MKTLSMNTYRLCKEDLVLHAAKGATETAGLPADAAMAQAGTEEETQNEKVASVANCMCVLDLCGMWREKQIKPE